MTSTDQILSRRVANILPAREGLADLMSRKKIKLYQGFDPTGGRLHLGHSIGIRKLMDFANAGHEVIFLFGTGTVLAGGGDPSGRDAGRKTITQEEIEENIKGWKGQVAPLVNWDKITVKQNGDWLVPLTLKEILEIASNISAIQLFKREMFQRRIEHGDTVSAAETFYPLLQGYDSVAMDVDLEIGGTDQEFNMLIGRELQHKMNNREKYVLTVPMILGTDGKQMSKSSGNCVWLNDAPDDMFAKLVAIPDEQIIRYLELVTDVSQERVDEIRAELEKETIHPLDAKKELARAVVSQLHNKDAAGEAQDKFESVFQNRQTPTDIPEYVGKKRETLVDVLFNSGSATSRSEAKRLIDQGAVELDGKKLTDANAPEVTGTLRIGKHRFLKVNSS